MNESFLLVAGGKNESLWLDIKKQTNGGLLFIKNGNEAWLNDWKPMKSWESWLDFKHQMSW